jgi:GNAT superfamily N-acetyltransferase
MVIEERNPSYDEYQALREAVGWRLTEDASTKKALANALYSVVALDSDKVVGIGRVIGDDGLYYYVQDLIVCPNYQGKGVGKKLMAKLMDFIQSHACPGSIIGLMAAPGLENFYKEFGFTSQPEYGTGMYIIID